MPTLNWIGKKTVENHHREVLSHLLKDIPDLSVDDPESGNLIVEGDNLLAGIDRPSVIPSDPERA